MPILELKANPSAIRRILRTILDTLFRRGLHSDGNHLPALERPCAGNNTNAESRHTDRIRQRLADAMTQLERITAERERRCDSAFGKTAESRIVWGELIELEVQEIDEQVSRNRGAAGGSPPAPAESNLRDGGSHERNDA
jgi:hypothetical protein